MRGGSEPALKGRLEHTSGGAVRPFRTPELAGGDRRTPARDAVRGYFVNVKLARWNVPSLNFTTSWRHVLAQALSVAQTYLYVSDVGS